jgi:hypothetical protein
MLKDEEDEGDEGVGGAGEADEQRRITNDYGLLTTD